MIYVGDKFNLKQMLCMSGGIWAEGRVGTDTLLQARVPLGMHTSLAAIKQHLSTL